MKTLFIIFLSLFVFTELYALDIRGKIALEASLFYQDGQLSEQERAYTSIEFSPDLYHEWDASQLSFTFKPFLRLDQHDDERSHGDIRELHFQKVYEDIEVKLGVSSVFWGVTEFNHLVDVINQTDSVENIDGEDKLGQPMLHLLYGSNWGTFEFFYLPMFRDRTFIGKKGRLRAPLTVDQDDLRYTSGAEEWHSDFALRWSHQWNAYDFALSYFNGTQRDPILTPDKTLGTLKAHYRQMEQLGLEVQASYGDWAFKLESIGRDSDGDYAHATTAGFEYTHVGIFGSDMDLGSLFEIINSRNSHLVDLPYQRMAFAGQRLVLNDIAGSEILAGYAFDSGLKQQSFILEASRRLNDHLKISLESRFFISAPANSNFDFLQDDDFSKLELAWYF